MVNVKWEELGFDYIKTPFRYISRWKNGQWDEGVLTEDNTITINGIDMSPLRTRMF